MELHKIISEKAHEITQRFPDVNFHVSFYHDELIFRVPADYGRDTQETIFVGNYYDSVANEVTVSEDMKTIEDKLEEFYKNHLTTQLLFNYNLYF